MPEQTLEDYEGVMGPLRRHLYSNKGKQPGDPRKAALVMIEAVERARPPLRLMIGADAYGLWEGKSARREAGEATALDGVEVPRLGVW